MEREVYMSQNAMDTTTGQFMRGNWRQVRTMKAATARGILENAQAIRDSSDRSAVNGAFTKAQVWDILWGAVCDLDDEASIPLLTAQNIVSEFGA